MLNKHEYRYVMSTTKNANKRMNVMYESDAHFFSCQKMFYNQLIKLINKKGTAKLRNYLKKNDPIQYGKSRIEPAEKDSIKKHIDFNPTYTYALKDLAKIVKQFRGQHDLKLYNKHLTKDPKRAITNALLFFVGDLTMQHHILPYKDDIHYIKVIQAGSMDFPNPAKLVHGNYDTLKYTTYDGSTDSKMIKIEEHRAMRREHEVLPE